MESDKIIEKSIPLYDTKDKESAILFDLNDGYIIVDETTNEVSEFNLSQDNQFFNDLSKHYVYGGPTHLYERENGQLINLETNQKETNDIAIQDSINLFKEKVEEEKKSNSNNSLANNSATSDEKLYGYAVGGKIPNLYHNPNGICGSCAAGNLLAFFCWNVDYRFVPNIYLKSINTESGDGKEFIRSIVPFVDGEDALDVTKKGGSKPEGLQQGLKRYLTEKVGYLGNVELNDLRKNRNPSVNKIKSGLPFILGLFKTPGNPYNNHWVLATGYVYRKPAENIVLYYKVTDGWGSDKSYVNVSWTDYMVAI